MGEERAGVKLSLRTNDTGESRGMFECVFNGGTLSKQDVQARNIPKMAKIHQLLKEQMV